ncbi:MAG: accessory factor UbiK family protein [Rhodospirillales bacterium]
MQTSNKILDDLAKVANGAVATMTGIKDEVEAMVRQQVERFLADGNLVPRDEFDAMAEVARNARAAQEKLEARVAKLEAALAANPAQKARKSATTAKKSTAKPAARKAPAAKGKA